MPIEFNDPLQTTPMATWANLDHMNIDSKLMKIAMAFTLKDSDGNAVGVSGQKEGFMPLLDSVTGNPMLEPEDYALFSTTMANLKELGYKFAEFNEYENMPEGVIS